MKEEEMRAKQYIAEKQEVHRKCSEVLLKQKDKFVHVPCPACGFEAHHFVFEKGGFEFVACKACGMTYVNPRPTFEMLMDYQKDSYEAARIWVEKIYPLSEDVRRKNIFRPRAQRVLELTKKCGCPTKRIVDVGAGYGTFGEEIVALGAFDEFWVVESSALCAESCRKKGLNVVEKPIEKAGLENVDVVTCFELIEHLFDPKEFITACKQNLSKSGLMIISTPNPEGFDMATLGSLSGTYQAPLHINYFNHRSICKLFESCGFKVVEVLTPGLLDAELVRNKALAGEYDVSNQPFLKHVLIDHWEEIGEAFQSFLSINKLSSHMWVAARNVA